VRVPGIDSSWWLDATAKKEVLRNIEPLAENQAGRRQQTTHLMAEYVMFSQRQVMWSLQNLFLQLQQGVAAGFFADGVE
jgi:hypothetical protein